MLELTALSSSSGNEWYRAIATCLNFYVSRGSRARLLRCGKRYYTYFARNSLLFPTVKISSIG